MADLQIIPTNIPLWKRQRSRILDFLIKSYFQDYDVFDLPTNVIRFHEKKSIGQVRAEELEAVLFDNFILVCKWAKNTPYIQCVLQGDKIVWHWGGNEEGGFEKQHPNVTRWMRSCFEFGTSLFDIQLILSRLRNDRTRGPTSATFCSLVNRYVLKQVFSQLDELAALEDSKNLLTLQRLCSDLNIRLLKPLKRLARTIERDEITGGELINYLFKQKGLPDNFHIVDLLNDCISLAIERYYLVILEWITQCTLSYDLAHEFFIWDLRKQQVVGRMEFGQLGEMDPMDLGEQRQERQGKMLSFDMAFVRIPQLIPEDFQSVSEEIYQIGKYLYIMRQQNASLELLSPQSGLDTATFKRHSLGEFCAQIVALHQQCSENILEHFRRQYDIVNFAKQLPRFYIGLNSSWIYEFAALFEENDLPRMEFDRLDANMTALLQQAFQSAELHAHSSYQQHFELKLSEFTKRHGQLEFAPEQGTYPSLELHISRDDAALRLAFPAKVLEPYKKIFFHLLLLNRAKYLLLRKYFLRAEISPEMARQECATIFLSIRFLNVYQEYICSIAANAYSDFARKLDSAKSLDELVGVQLEFVHEMMEEAKLDQENQELRQWMELLTNMLSLYGEGTLDFPDLNREAAPLVGKIKKHFLEHRRSLNTLKNILFGCYFSTIGALANEEPLWKLLQHVDRMPE